MEVNVESELEKLQQKTEVYEPGRVQLAAIRFYLGYMVQRWQTLWTNTVTKGVTNYKTLVDQIARRPIGKQRVCLVTFNYDTLLDDALVSRGMKLRTLGEYVRNNFGLVKLHGSTNWAHPINDFDVKTGENTTADK